MLKQLSEAFKVISFKLYTVFTVTRLQEKNPKSRSSFQTNQKMSPNCIVLRTLTWTSHVFIKVFQGFPNLVRARDADRAIDGAGRLGGIRC